VPLGWGRSPPAPELHDGMNIDSLLLRKVQDGSVPSQAVTLAGGIDRNVAEMPSGSGSGLNIRGPVPKGERLSPITRSQSPRLPTGGDCATNS